jgi:membrane protease YdiL (CAAX protease family)
MTVHTPSLDLLVLTASAFPTQLVSLPAQFGVRRSELWIVPVAVWLTCALALTLSSQPVVLVGDDPSRWIGIALVAGGAVLLVELLVGSVWSWVATGRRPSGVELAEGVTGVGTPLALSTAVTGFGEETLFRGVWLAVLLGAFGWPAIAVGALVTVVYALNHAHLGLDIVVQKLCAGAIFFALAYAGGGVLAAGIAHVVENLLIAFLPLLQMRARRVPA